MVDPVIVVPACNLRRLEIFERETLSSMSRSLFFRQSGTWVVLDFNSDLNIMELHMKNISLEYKALNNSVVKVQT